MNINIPKNKRAIVAYSSGTFPEIRQNYYLINYPAGDPEFFLKDVDNMVDHYFNENVRPHIDVPLDFNQIQATVSEKPKKRTKKQIRAEMDKLLEELKGLK